jgi:hypothetical protein
MPLNMRTAESLVETPDTEPLSSCTESGMAARIDAASINAQERV